MNKLQPLPCKVSKTAIKKRKTYFTSSTLTSGVVLIYHKKPLCNRCSHLANDLESKHNK